MMETAVVIGSGIAGLAAATALARRFKRVVVIERDARPGNGPRPGVPQSAQFHVLLQAGADALEGLFPGIDGDIARIGGAPIDFGSDLAWRHFGCWKTRARTGFASRPLTRPELEGLVRARVEALEGVEVRYETRCEGLLLEGERVEGVRLAGPDGEEVLRARLVVDASGRASKLGRWLESAGYETPREDRIQLGLMYTCGHFSVAPAAAPGWRALLLSPAPPDNRRGAALQLRADGSYFGGAWGYHGDHPPTDMDGLREFARGLASDELHRVLLAAEPLGPLRSFGVPYQRWSHYEHAARLPDGLLALGDVLCSFDPVFGQGMSVAVLEASLLARLLEQGQDPAARSFRRAFFTGSARIIATPWAMAAGEAFRFAETQGPRPPGLAVLHPFVAAVARLGATDVDAYRAFLRVMHLLDAPTRLFHPRILWKLVVHRLRPRAAP